MKKMFLFGCLFLGLGLSANAQEAKKECSKPCSKTCTKTASASTDADVQTKVASVVMTADQAAEANENIEKRVCSTSGTVSYYEKSTCPVTSKVSWNEVEYCNKSNKFTRVASASVEREVAPADIKVNGMEKADAAPAKKECSKGKAECCASKKKTKS